MHPPPLFAIVIVRLSRVFAVNFNATAVQIAIYMNYMVVIYKGILPVPNYLSSRSLVIKELPKNTLKLLFGKADIVDLLATPLV